MKRLCTGAALAALIGGGAGGCSSGDEPSQVERPQFVDAGSDAQVAPTPCNLEAPSCPDTAPKCSVVDRSDGSYTSVCVPRAGTRAPGETCEREALGRDDCAPGALCSSVALAGDATTTRVCRTLCNAAEQCDAPERCYRFSLGQPQVYGMCVPPCEPLGSDCGPGRHCIFVQDAAEQVFAMCDSHGQLAEGDACLAPQDCGKDMACGARAPQERSCRFYCDAAHPCADASRACTPLNFPEFPGLGLCLPPAS